MVTRHDNPLQPIRASEARLKGSWAARLNLCVTLSQWAKESPRRLAGLWFAGFRLVWAIYWFGRPMKSLFVFRFVAGLLPIILSVLAAGLVGYFLGSSILDPDRTKSYWMAGLKGILIQHLTTVLYLPVGALITSLSAGELTRFLPSLYLSFIFSLAGISIHTGLGAATGLLLYHVQTRKSGGAS
jgi:hypothetical protein